MTHLRHAALAFAAGRLRAARRRAWFTALTVCCANALLAGVPGIAGCKKSASSPPATTEAKPVSAAPVGDAGAAAPHLSKLDLKRFQRALAVGKRLERKGQHARAAKAFETALSIRPDHPAALAELAWAELQAGDLAHADQAARRAIAVATGSGSQAAALYTLGRVEEAEKHKEGAIAAFRQSLELRPNHTVREQLARLDPAAAAAFDPLRPDPLAGPFPSLAAFCRKLGGDNAGAGQCPLDGGASDQAKDPAPYQEVRLFEESDDSTCHLALRLASGWFVDESGFTCRESPYLEQTVDELAVRELSPGGARGVVLAVTNFHSTREDVELESDDGTTERGRALVPGECDAETWMCGVGRSGTPSCIHLATAGGKQHCDDGDEKKKWEWRLAATFTPDGKIDVKASGRPPAEAKAEIGRRPFAWP